jgi:hypothetical protein
MDFEQDELPPLPQLSSNASPKRTRRRLPSSSNAAIVSSTVVPTPGPDQVISTLIDSLTAISQGARDHLKQEFQDAPSLEAFHTESPNDDFFERPPSPGSFYAESAVAPSYFAASEYGDESDREAAAPPVIRFSRAPATPKKRSKNSSDKPANTMPSDRGLSMRASFQSLRSQDISHSGLTVNKRSSSVTSLALSLRSARSRSPRKKSSVPTSRDQSPQARPQPDRIYSDSQVTYEHRRTDSETSRRESGPHTPGEETRAGTTLSPLNRENLGRNGKGIIVIRQAVGT